MFKKKVKKSNAKFVGNATLIVKGKRKRFAVYQDGRCISKDHQIIKVTPDKLYLIRKAIEEERQKLRMAHSTEQAKDEAPVEEIKIDDATQAPVDSVEEVADNDIEFVEEEIEPYEDRKVPSVAKRILATVIYIAVIGGTIFGSLYILDNHEAQVAIVQLSKAAAKDSELAEGKIQPMLISESAYQKLKSVVSGDIILWNDAPNYFGKFFAGDTVKGSFLTTEALKNKKVISNPWLLAQGEGIELYTLPLSSDTIYNQLLYPGTEVRVRVVKGGDIVPETKPKAENESEEGTEDETIKRSEPSTEDLFQRLTIIDMLNANGESIYDLYSGLSIMSKDERKAYYKSLIKDEKATAYFERFHAVSLIFALTDEQVSAMAKVENNPNAVLKYTVLPSYTLNASEEQVTALYTFKEINKEMADIFGEANIVE